MELPSRTIEEIAFITRPKIEKHMLIVMDKSKHEEHLSQPLPTNRQFKIAVTFLSGYNGIFNVPSKHIKFYFANSFTDKDGFVQLSIAQGAYELESLNDEIKRIIIGGHFTEADYPFTIQPIFQHLDLLWNFPDKNH